MAIEKFQKGLSHSIMAGYFRRFEYLAQGVNAASRNFVAVMQSHHNLKGEGMILEILQPTALPPCSNSPM